jgi:DNA-directed RNA polymerase specialized sigma24 family protein
MNNQIENTKRLEVLYKKSHSWLSACAFNIAKDEDVANDLVAELYLYLAEKVNPSLWYLDTFNLMYLYSFIKSRFLNRIKTQSRNLPLLDNWDKEEEVYDVEYDKQLEDTYNNVIEELKQMEKTKQWASSKLAQLYFFNEEMTLEKLASEIKISKSTAFLNVKKTKTHIKNTIDNPFTKR